MTDKSPIEWTEATWNPIAGCSVTSASAELEGEDNHDDHDAEHSEHDSEHQDHDDHDEHDDEHENEAGHTEFHAEYLLDCTDPSAAHKITFHYFEAFPNALEVEVQIISDKGAGSFEVERSAPTLDLSGAL